MKYFKDATDAVHAFDAKQLEQGYPLTPMTAMSTGEVEAHTNPPKTAEQTLADLIASYIRALEAHYDANAQQRRYDGRLTCALRAGYPGPFQAEGLAFAIWMDECNAYAYAQLSLIGLGERGMPTEAEMPLELPVLVWP
jgi:hypothetical protein